MNLPCSVVRDLLPLYAEDLASEESSALVKEHLDGCADCRSQLDELRRGPEPAEGDHAPAAPMRSVKKELRKRRLRSAAIAALCVFLLLFALFARATNATPLDYSPALLQVEGLEPYEPNAPSGASGSEDSLSATGWKSAHPGEALVILVNERVPGEASEYYYDEGTGELTVYLQYFSTHAVVLTDESNGSLSLKMLEGGGGRQVLYPAPDRVYYGFGEKQVLLWGDEMEGGVQILPRLALAYYALAAAALTVVLLLLWLLLRRKRVAGVLRQLSFAPLAYLLGQVLVKGFDARSIFLTRDLSLIAIAAAGFYALLTLLCLTWAQRRKDKAA